MIALPGRLQLVARMIAHLLFFFSADVPVEVSPVEVIPALPPVELPSTGRGGYGRVEGTVLQNRWKTGGIAFDFKAMC